MDAKTAAGLLVIVLLAHTSHAQEAEEGYLIPTCEATFRNDYVNLIKVRDVDRDGTLDILAGTSIQGLLYDFQYKGADCTVDWSPQWTFNTKGDVRSIMVGNLDSYPENEVLVNAVKSRVGDRPPSEYYYVLSQNGVEKWNFDKECGWTKSVYAADVDGTGVINTIMGSLSGKICVIKDNHKDKKPVLWSYTAEHPVDWVTAADIDGDGKLEVIALAYRYNDAVVIALDSKGKLRWKKEIEGGIYSGGGLDKIAVEDLNGDGMFEVVVGSYKHGVDVLNHDGILKWNYDTGGSLVSVVYVDDIDKNGRKEVLVGAKPFVYALSDRGGLLWKSGVKTTVYSIHAADINKDGEGDVVVGSTRYVNVYDGSTGSLAGAWTYKEEIQGLTTVFEVKDANARSIQAADLDGDGDVELVVGFGWEEDQLDKTFHFGDIRVLEVNKSYNLFATKPTVKPEPQVQDVVETTTTTTIRTATTLGEYGPYTPTETKPVDSGVEDEGGGLCCLPLLPAVLALAFSLMAGTAVKLS